VDLGALDCRHGLQPDRDPELTARIAAAIGNDHRLFQLISPNSIVFNARIQEIVVLVIVAVTLAVAVRRSNDLLIRHAVVECERGNLARYFSPNVVEELSKNDEPLKQVRTQNVAVLFVDIVGFTAFADTKAAGEAPIRVSFGLHYGPVVLGDIGLTRLEFAVIGSTVNAASRLETLTRTLGCSLVASDDLIERAKAELGSAHAVFRPLMAQAPQAIRGLEHPIEIWTQRA
jgi:class 3 adenylate cyclase